MHQLRLCPQNFFSNGWRQQALSEKQLCQLRLTGVAFGGLSLNQIYKRIRSRLTLLFYFVNIIDSLIKCKVTVNNQSFGEIEYTVRPLSYRCYAMTSPKSVLYSTQLQTTQHLGAFNHDGISVVSRTVSTSIPSI